MKKIETDTAVIIFEDDLVKCYVRPDVDLNSEAAIQAIEVIRSLIDGKKAYYLVMPDASSLITVDIKKFKRPEFDDFKKAEAIVIKTLGHRLLAQMYVKLRKLPYPVKIFSEEEEALQWIERLRKLELNKT